MEKAKGNFTSGKIFPQLLWFVLPIMATNLLQTLYNAADMIVVSYSSQENAVGAIGTTNAFLSLIVHLFIGFSVGATVVVARSIGAKNREDTQKAVHTALIMSFMFGVLGAAVGLAISRPILQMMGNTGSLLNLAVKYTYIYFAGVPFLSMTNYLIAIYRAKGDSKTPLLVLAISGLLNVLLNMCFVLGFDMSVEGVSLATVAANVFSFVVLLWKLHRVHDDTNFSFKRLKVDKKAMKDIVRIGLPSGVQGALFAVSNMMVQSSVVSVNNAVCPINSDYQPIVNGNAAASNLEGFVYTAMNSVAQGAITFTGQNMGAEKPKRVKPIMYNCYLLTTLVGLLLGGALMLFRNPLLAFYGIHEGTVGSLERIAYNAAIERFLIVCMFYFLCGMMDVGSGVLRGLNRSMLSTVITLVGSCLLRVLWILFVFPLRQTLQTIFLCYPITWFLTAATLFIVVQVLLKRMIKEHEKNPT